MTAQSYGLEMSDLLLAMKSAAIADTELLGFVTDVQIMSAASYPTPQSEYTLYLVPMGSPETPQTDQGDVYAEHFVFFDCVIATNDPNEENAIGRGSVIGITTFFSRAIQFFSGNMFGLTAADGMEEGFPPVCDAMRDTFVPLTGRGRYRARTRPFRRAA
jgi:hypothetical protein